MIFKDSIKKNSLKTCLIDDTGEKHSYGDIYKESKVICNNLQKRSLILVLAEVFPLIHTELIPSSNNKLLKFSDFLFELK